MSAQGTIVRRRGTHLPIWPVAALLVAAVTTAVGLGVLDGLGGSEPVTASGRAESIASVTDGTAPTIRELPSGPFHEAGRAHEVVLDSPVEATMPVQRLYPEGFGDVTDDEAAPMFDGRRRKW